MLSFSQRQGLKPVKNAFQIDSMDSDLRTGLWNVLSMCFWEEVEYPKLSNYPKSHGLLRMLWGLHFKRPLDNLSDYWPHCYKRLTSDFFNASWNEVYDFIEFIARNNLEGEVGEATQFTMLCNEVLERECSAYRFVGKQIAQVTSEVEIAEIEQAIQSSSSSSLMPVTQHFKTALELLSDRTSPDYRNSIKESIIAVEAISKLITGNSGTTLGRALATIESQGQVQLHTKLKDGFINLYGYTSDAHGIRHALKDDEHPAFEDARYMLVSCSAFVNYLIEKATKAGIAF